MAMLYIGASAGFDWAGSASPIERRSDAPLQGSQSSMPGVGPASLNGRLVCGSSRDWRPCCGCCAISRCGSASHAPKRDPGDRQGSACLSSVSTRRTHVDEADELDPPRVLAPTALHVGVGLDLVQPDETDLRALDADDRDVRLVLGDLGDGSLGTATTRRDARIELDADRVALEVLDAADSQPDAASPIAGSGHAWRSARSGPRRTHRPAECGRG